MQILLTFEHNVFLLGFS